MIFGANHHIKFFSPGTAPSKKAIWEKFNERQKSEIFDTQFTLFWCKESAKLMHILVGKHRDNIFP